MPQHLPIVALLALSCLSAAHGQVDSDGDGLLDLLDVPNFNPNATGTILIQDQGIEDLDGANLLTSVTGLDLRANRIAGIEPGDFGRLAGLTTLALAENQIDHLANGALSGLDQLEQLDLADNAINRIEPETFARMVRLRHLNLQGNVLSELDFTGATLENLSASCDPFSLEGLCVDVEEIELLVADDARTSQSAWTALTAAAEASVSDMSLVGLTFSDVAPPRLFQPAPSLSLLQITVDADLASRYSCELQSFAARGGVITSVRPGDGNADGAVNLDDFLNLAAGFGSPGRWSDGDFDRSGIVGFPDFLLLAVNFDPLPGASAPEPNGCDWTLLVALVGLRRRQRKSRGGPARPC